MRSDTGRLEPLILRSAREIDHDQRARSRDGGKAGDFFWRSHAVCALSRAVLARAVGDDWLTVAQIEAEGYAIAADRCADFREHVE